MRLNLHIILNHPIRKQTAFDLERRKEGELKIILKQK